MTAYYVYMYVRMVPKAEDDEELVFETATCELNAVFLFEDTRVMIWYPLMKAAPICELFLLLDVGPK
jgi:hypothetical protein